MAGSSRQIRDAVMTALADITYDDEPAFVSIKGSTKGEFDGYPALRVLPSPEGLANVKSSMAQQDRTVSLSILGHIELENKDPDPSVDVEKDAIDQMLDLTDLIVDRLDQVDFDNTLAVDTDTDTYIMNTESGEWNWVVSGAGALLLFLVNVKVTYSKNMTSGT